MHQAPSTADAATSQYIYDQGSARSDGKGNIGVLTSTIDPRNNSTTYIYDTRDRQISVTDPLGNTTISVFDQRGVKTSETRPNHPPGEVSVEYVQYDAMNRLRHQIVHRESGVQDHTYSTYDAAGNLDTHTDEDGNIYNYDYDALNRPTQLQYPNLKTEVHTYDAAGNVQTYTNRSGWIQTFTYDNRNRQLTFSWSNEPTSQHTSGLSTVYDRASRKTQIVNDDATINFGYQDDNKLQWQEEWVTASGVGNNPHRTVTYHYDADGNRDWITYPSGTKFDYDYTQRNQVADIKLDGALTPIVSYTFDPAGNVMGRALDNNTSTAYTVDQANRDTAVVHGLTGGPKRFDYAYNNVNDITVVQRDLGQGDKFEYDSTQQIKRFAQNGNVDLTNGTIATPQTDTNMTFDGCGNQTSLNGGGTFQKDTLNEYTTYNGAAVGNDVDGNVHTYNGWTYTYDAQNRLRQAASATATETFYYDGLNRQVARVTSAGTGTPTPTPTPMATPTPTPLSLPTIPPTPTVSPSVPALSPTPTIPVIGTTPTPTPTLTPTATPTPTPAKCSTPTISESGGQITMTKNTPGGSTIFYTVQEDTPPGAPTHSGGTATGTTQAYSTPIPVAACLDKYFKAIEYKSGYADSDVTPFASKHATDFGCNGGGAMMMNSSSSTVTIFSVWDGDWAILEEYDGSGNLVEKYLQGYHGLVKTFVQNVYYYQDELGSTSHIASPTGALIESYQYEVYGKPQVYDSGGVYQAGATPLANDLFTGQRWRTELGLYDDRNRFMSPDLGRFLQPDPIGFKGDASNLYRYCGNDWANRTDPMGLEDSEPHHAANKMWYDPQKNLAKASVTFNLKEWKTQVWFRGNPFQEVAGATGANAPTVLPEAPARHISSWNSPVRVTGGTFRQRQYMRHELKRALATPRGKELTGMIKQQGIQRVINVMPGWGNAQSQTPGVNSWIDPDFHPCTATSDGPIYASTARIIGHELGHSVTGAGRNEIPGNAMDNVNQNENPIANSLGEPSRVQYQRPPEGACEQ